MVGFVQACPANRDMEPPTSNNGRKQTPAQMYALGVSVRIAIGVALGVALHDTRIGIAVGVAVAIAMLIHLLAPGNNRGGYSTSTGRSWCKTGWR